MTSHPATKAHPALARDSREVLLAAAGEVFAERGYEAATVKEITDRAGVNVASVSYYFRDKLGLYTEVLRRSLCSSRLALPPEAATQGPERRLGLYIEAFMKALVGTGRPSWSGNLMVREVAQPTAALPQVVEEVLRPNLILLGQLVEEVAGRSLPEEELSLLTHAIHAQCVHWKTSRSVCPMLWPSLRLDETQAPRIAEHITAFSIAGIRAITAKERQ